MRIFHLNKLVHDEIVQGHLDEGGQVDYDELAGKDLTEALEAKLREERAELEAAENVDEKAKEQDDIDNILFALGRLGSEDYRPTKTFTKGHFIHTVTLPATSRWAEYYAADPIRFPEETADTQSLQQ